MGGTIILWGSQSGSHAQHIAPRPADQYPDISLAPNNPMSVALTERHHEMVDLKCFVAKVGVDTAENEPSEICGIGSRYMYLKEGLYLGI